MMSSRVSIQILYLVDNSDNFSCHSDLCAPVGSAPGVEGSFIVVDKRSFDSAPLAQDDKGKDTFFFLIPHSHSIIA